LAPAKTPAAVIAKLNDAVNGALNDAPTRDKLVQAGATPVGGTPASFGTFMKAEYEKWGRVVKERNIKETQ
jgi:tripartite-type tricarboxylate transporter receptor subunit TctC